MIQRQLKFLFGLNLILLNTLIFISFLANIVNQDDLINLKFSGRPDYLEPLCLTR
jgi:hypothetical protein